MAGKKSWMGKNMSDNQFRPEQIYCAELFAEVLPKGWKIEMEYLVGFTHWNAEEKQPKKALVDIALLLPPAIKVAIRLNGEVHEKPRQKIKDEDQRINLEKEGWAVFDFNKSTMPELWDRKTYSNKEAQSAINREMS